MWDRLSTAPSSDQEAINIYIYIYIYTCVYIYIYIYRALTMIVFTMIVPAITHDDSATSPHIHTAHT